MSKNVYSSLIVTGQQGLPPFRAVDNSGLDAFVVGADSFIYIYNVPAAAVIPTYDYLVKNPSTSRVEYVNSLTLSGTSGTSGTAGTSGTSGTTGTSGTSGTTGTSGTSGTSGTDGSSGTAGTSGTSGTQGPPGPPGSSGTSGTYAHIEFLSTDTIIFVTQSTPTGLTVSAIIATASIGTSLLATASNGGATAGYVLSNTGDGNFAWVPQSTGTQLDVVDYMTGTTFSAVSTMIFRGGALTVPSSPATTGGATGLGVLVTGPAPTVTVWIPAPNYVDYFNPSLGSGTARYVSQPTTDTYNSTPGNSGQFGIGSWTPMSNFNSSTSRSTINTNSITAFTDTEFACYTNTTTMTFTLYDQTGLQIAQISNYTINGASSTSSGGLTLTVNSFLPNNDRYKASVTGTIAVNTVFPNGGRFKWIITHNNGEGAGNAGAGIYSFTSQDIFYDNDGSVTSASIANGVDFDELTPTTVQYSGVKFYAMNSTFALTASNINMINEISFPTTKQIDFVSTNMAISSTLNGYADGSKSGIGDIITGWTIDWNKSGLTYSRTATVNFSGQYIPNYTNNTTNLVSTTPASYVTGRLYDWGSPDGSSQSVSRRMLFDTVSPSAPNYTLNPLQSEQGRLSSFGVLSNGSTAFDSTQSIINTDDLQYMFGRIIYPQQNMTQFYPTFNWTASVNYSSLTGSNRSFTVILDSNTNTSTSLSFNGYRWFVSSYGKTAAYDSDMSNGVFTLNSNFAETDLHFNTPSGVTGNQDLVILVGYDDSSSNTTPNKFLFVSGDPGTYNGRINASINNLNNATETSKKIEWSQGLLGISMRKVWLFIGYKDSTFRGKNLRLSSVTFVGS
jgi:hypothetical protein